MNDQLVHLIVWVLSTMFQDYENNNLKCIKYIKEATGLGLRQSKDISDRIGAMPQLRRTDAIEGLVLLLVAQARARVQV